jgi:predicted TPR repeat methyltransferase
MSGKAAFWLATMDSSPQRSVDVGVVHRCPKEYIVSLYSTFASNFDDLLVNKLHYQTPSKLRQVVDQMNTSSTSTPPDKFKCCLDLGCGTGLSGLAFRDCVEDLVGVDLSPEMIERAKQRNCYKNLFVGDLESVFVVTPDWTPPVFDIVIACDVFVYIGDLKSIFHSIRKNVTCDGVFAFSTEALDEETCGTNPFTLHKNARFAHKKSYIENLANKTEFMLDSMTKTVIRKNKGTDVQGFLVVLRPVN